MSNTPIYETIGPNPLAKMILDNIETLVSESEDQLTCTIEVRILEDHTADLDSYFMALMALHHQGARIWLNPKYSGDYAPAKDRDFSVNHGKLSFRNVGSYLVARWNGPHPNTDVLNRDLFKQVFNFCPPYQRAIFSDLCSK